MRNIEAEILAELRKGYDVTVEYMPIFGPVVTFDHQPVGWGGFPYQQGPAKTRSARERGDKH